MTTSAWLDTFALLVARDGAVCYLDGEPADEDDPLEIEHFIPTAATDLTDDDLDDLDNLRLAHRSCNRKKGTAGIPNG
jgi:5-methylcytosine-specific restriction endonuclease McrA